MAFARIAVRLLLAAVIAAAALLPTGTTGAAPAREPAPARAAACAALGSLSGNDVFVAGNMDVSNNQLLGAAAAGGDITMSGFGVSAGLPPDGSRVDLVAGANLNVSNAHANGSVLYGGTLTGSIAVPSGGSVSHGSPTFIFSDEIALMQLLSFTWAGLPTTGTTTPSGEVLQLAGAGAGLNVFSVTAAQLQGARNITISVPAGASAMVNVTGASYSTAVSGAYGAGNSAVPTVWNFVNATSVQISGLNWYGTVLAPGASITASNGQIYGHIWGRDWNGSGTVLPSTLPPCLPAPPKPVIELEALCVNGVTNELLMRLRNKDERDRVVKWSDEDSAQEGLIHAGAATDNYFAVLEGDEPHTIVATSGGERVVAHGVTRRCRSTIEVHKTTSGKGTPPPGEWAVTVNGTSGFSQSKNLAAGGTVAFVVPGAYLTGSLPIGDQPSGYLYSITEPDPRGAIATIEPELVSVTDAQRLSALLDNRYDAAEPEVPPPIEPPIEPPVQPPIEPPLPGVPLVPIEPASPGRQGADLAISEQFSKAKVQLGQTFEATVHIRNQGHAAAVGTVAEELPQADPLNPNRVARILGVSGAPGCTQSRPVTCQLGTIQPGQEVTLHARVRPLITGSLVSVVRVHSATPELNTTNNVTGTGIVVTVAPTKLAVHVTAPALVSVGTPMRYQVHARVGTPAGASFVRICQRPPTELLITSAPSTFRRHGSICRDVWRIPRGGAAGFTVNAIASAAGAGRTLALPARASAPGLATAHGHTNVAIASEGFSGNG